MPSKETLTPHRRTRTLAHRRPRVWGALLLCGLWATPARAEMPEQNADGLPACFEVTNSAGNSFEETLELQPDNLQEALGQDAKIFYLNRDGGTYVPGAADDSRRNRSSLAVTESTIPAWNIDDENWAEIVDCVRGLFEPYNAFVTDVDPIGPTHVEAVVGGSYLDLNNQLQRPVGGVAPFPSDCGVIENSVVFAFAEDALGDNRQVCEVIAHEIAHSYGLDHSFFCEDIMSYLVGCGDKTFVNGAVPCGEANARECMDVLSVPPTYDCEKETQNPAFILAERIGLAPSPAARGGCNASGQNAWQGAWIFLLAFLGAFWSPSRKCQTKKI